MDQEGAQIGIASFADTQQSVLAAGAVLTRHQPDPCRGIPASLKHLAITQRGNQCGGRNRPNTSQFQQTACFRMRMSQLVDCLIQAHDPFIQIDEVFP